MAYNYNPYMNYSYPYPPQAAYPMGMGYGVQPNVMPVAPMMTPMVQPVIAQPPVVIMEQPYHHHHHGFLHHLNPFHHHHHHHC